MWTMPCRPAVIHLIKQLVGDDEVVPQRLLFQLVEVVHKHLLELVQEAQEGSCIDVGPRRDQQVQVGVLDVGVGDALM